MANSPDWNPGAYERFRDLRLRPGLDLLNAVGQMAAGDVIDLGCGNGQLGPALKARAEGRSIVGVDASPAMLEKARTASCYASLQQADIRDWHPRRAPGLIFSNAALHWVGEHEKLLPRLAQMLAKGGTLAVQMPHQNKAPSHRVWLSLSEEMFPNRIEKMGTPGVMAPQKYDELLAPMGRFRLWETEYYQRLVAEKGSHPVRRYTESTYARPVLNALEADEKAELIRRYEEAMQVAYPVRADGSVLFPFRRLFFTLTV
ncbi:MULTISPECIES: methyltransferase domain-containing protein [Roseovarius]|jgi:trans-aconitate 2-methyltransferase|uniref:Trans-aconitate methyltransferase n=2 Tax=Roseovarius nubinhibens TaxID=314263 RepID=A3SIU7_ROSNI|nr:trans-aconitate methyltransferase [Roseovarius nubinhibens ISM]HAR52426.1 methyltransferase domain-containing protein [Roseovarius nubinhibens]|tara:strand:- start:3308 stop:4084 length:777 start_codon:yes stop_codon:yes gene_type:complete